MNLKEEMEKVKFISNGVEFDKRLELISKNKAIEIAEKYAEEMCKKQIELCVEAFIKQRQLFLEFDFDIKLREVVFADTIENTLLATELKDESI